MSLELLADPLFRVPLVVGLLVAAVLPLLGALLRLREEWLAALGLAYLSAAAGLAGLAIHVPVVVGAPLGGLLGALAKTGLKGRGNTAYAFMILIGWGATMLVAANTALGHAMGHALVDGQLYFTGAVELVAAAACALLVLAAWPWMAPRLIRAHFFPAHESANRLPAWRWHLGFDLLVAGGMALGTATVGLMAAFALVFVPPWLAFRAARSWRGVLLICAGMGLLGYLLAFMVAMALDQPFGPVLVVVMLTWAAGGWLLTPLLPPRRAARG
jgi:zinc transport system permease protein